MAVLTRQRLSPPTSPLAQPSLFGGGEPAVDASFSGLRRTWLDRESWVDHAPGWLSGGDEVLAALTEALAWTQRTVTMYDRVLPEPRLTAGWSDADRTIAMTTAPVLHHARECLDRRYERPFDTLGCNLYRDGADSVAWHGDRERFAQENPVVAIVSTGAPRLFRIRPTPRASERGMVTGRTGGGRGVASLQWALGDGDLLVMGGACQHDWQHCVPKTTKQVGPRLSIMFRHHLAGLDT